MKRFRFPQLHEILYGTSVLCCMIGAAGMTGTWETNGPVYGIITAAVILFIGIVCWIWAMYEDGQLRRK